MEFFFRFLLRATLNLQKCMPWSTYVDIDQGNGAGPVEWILSRGGPNTMNGAGQTEIPEFTL